MSKVIRDVKVTWVYTGTISPDGFEIAFCEGSKDPNLESYAFGKSATTTSGNYTFKSVVVDSGVTYRAYVRAVFGSKVGNWLQDDVTFSITANNDDIVLNATNFATANDLTLLQNQVDGKIETWFEDYVPTLTNAPYTDWTTTEEKTKHLGDLFYDTSTGYAYRFTNNSGYAWTVITDNDVAQAIQTAQDAQTTADGKITTFYQDAMPSTGAEGDLWIDTNDGYKLYRHNGTTFVSIQDTKLVKTDASNAPSSLKNSNLNLDFTSNILKIKDGTTDISSQTLSKTTLGLDYTDGATKNITYKEPSAPTVALNEGDIWLDSSDGNQMYIYKNGTWEAGKSGQDGTNGTNGINGTNATNRYVWVKYADTPTSGISDNPSGKKYIGIAYNKTTSTESTNYGDYSWALVKGADGESASMIAPIDKWYLGIKENVSDGVVGDRVLRMTHTSGYPYNFTKIAINTSRKYKVSFWARASSGTNGLLYFCLKQYKTSSTLCSTNGGRSPYYPSGVSKATHDSNFGTNAWGYYEHIWENGDWQSGVTLVLPEFLGNYSGSAGYWEVQGLSMTDVTDLSNSNLDIEKSGSGFKLKNAGTVTTVTLSKGDVGLPNTVDGANKTYIDSNGKIQGVSSGANTVVNNTKITINANGTLSGAGSGQVTTTGIGAETPSGSQAKANSAEANAKELASAQINNKMYLGFGTYAGGASISYPTSNEIALSYINDTSTGMCSGAINVEAGKPIDFSFEAKVSSSSTSSGFYCRIAEYDGDLPSGKVALTTANYGADSRVQSATREKTSFRENKGLTTEYVTYSFTYTPTSSAKWASLMLLNWDGLGSRTLYIRNLKWGIEISANHIKSGTLQSQNWGTGAGSQFDLNGGTFKLGGSSNPSLEFNGSTLTVNGSLTISDGTVSKVLTKDKLAPLNFLYTDRLDGTAHSNTVTIAPYNPLNDDSIGFKTYTYSLGGKFMSTLTLDGQLIANSSTQTNTLTLYENGTSLSDKYLGKTAKASDSDKLDGISSASFLRSDADDNVSCHLEFQDNKELRFGNDADFRMFFNGSHTYFRNYNHSSGNIYFEGEDKEGTNHALLYLRTDTSTPYVSLYGNGSEKLKTSTNGIQVYGTIYTQTYSTSTTTTTGYTRLLNGLFLQWGYIDGATTGGTQVTFPLTFGGGLINLQVSGAGNNYLYSDATIQWGSVTNTGFKIMTHQSYNTRCYWMALGK